MNHNQLIILCDEIRTGKTSAINDSLKSLRPCMGFICPDIDGTRKLVDLNSMKIHDFQIKKPIYSGDIKIGKFTFLGSTFKLAHKLLEKVPDDFKGHIIIDEIGKLELNNKGLEPALTRFLNRRSLLNATVVIVIRNYLLEEVMQKYALNDAVIMDPESFKIHFKIPHLNVG